MEVYVCPEVNYSTTVPHYSDTIPNLRDSSTTVRLPKPRSNSLKKSFMYDGAFIWNSLPENIRESKTLSIFERKIATHHC